MTFLQSLARLVRERKISEVVALQTASNPHELQRELRGISANAVLA